MAKSTNGGKTKSATGAKTEVVEPKAEPKARRAPARRRTDKKTDAPIGLASEQAVPEQTSAGQPAVMAAASPEFARPFEAAELNPEEVRRRAFEIYCGRGCTDGSDLDDWLEAKRQLEAERRLPGVRTH